MGTRWIRQVVAVTFVTLVTVVTSAGCGGSGGPTAPAAATLAAPSNFRIVQQRIELTFNEVQFSWTGTAASYRVLAGTALGGTDLLSTDVTGTSYTWQAPRTEGVFYVRVVAVRGSETSSPTPEFPVYTIDLRHVIDAIFFRSGPMSDSPNNAFSNPSAGVWASGSAIRVVVSSQAGEVARGNAQTFVNDYAALVGGAITATTETTADDLRSATLGTMPPFNVFVRVMTGFCSAQAIACAFYGPAPIGSNRSIVTQNGTGGFESAAHEMGHAYGMGHVRVTAAVRPELNFMMNPQLVSVQMTAAEKTAIATALSNGIRGGTTRGDALAMGLVLPFTGVSALPFGVPAIDRSLDRCVVMDRDGASGR